jgi:hypothetical protein
MRIPHRFVLLLFLLAPLPAHAGCMAMPTVCAAYSSTPLIFRGRVVQITPVPPPPPPPPNSGRGYDGGPYDHVRLQVLEAFKGDPGPEITILGSDPMFGKGGEFLIFALPNPQTGEFVANTCLPTSPVTGPRTPADLAWLRAYPSAQPTAIISGSVSFDYGDTGIPTISVTLTGPTTLTTSTAADHTYAFKDLPPGAYTVTAVLPAGYTTTREKNTAAVTVAAKGCAEVDFAIRHDTQQPAR